MFDGLLPSNINIYATTAANPSESSYGIYCSPDDVVNGKHIGSCLGDLYSINWMEDTDSHNPGVESLST
jgi:legumain